MSLAYIVLRHVSRFQEYSATQNVEPRALPPVQLQLLIIILLIAVLFVQILEASGILYGND